MKALPKRLAGLARAPLPRDKADTLLLLASAVLVLAPHTLHLPVWVSLLCCATLVWRGAITLLGRRMPPGLLLLPLAAGAMVGVFQSYHTLLGRDAGVAMLVLLVAFKMLEMHARRDLFVVVFLCFFLVLTNFFYSQSIGTALLMVASVLSLLTAQLSFQFAGSVPPLRRRVLLAARILGLAAPLALLLFFAFPRIQGPLWGMPSDAANGRTGLSDQMSPGKLSSLAQSQETAFRVRFNGPAPAQTQLYWRGPVLGSFDGSTWSRLRARPQRADDSGTLSITVRGEPVRYQVTLEASNARWLFALEMPRHLPEVSGNLAFVSPELELTAAYPVEQRVRYEMASFLDFHLQPASRLENGTQWLLLPYGFNPRALAAGRQLRAEPDPVQRVAAVLRQFSSDNYVYTLEPPLLGRDSVDEFLYETRAGFCEHYAGAFVFLMRAAGIPARVVTGYQGGEINPVDGYLTVRQADAHAWAEVWLAGRGWVRIDPTAAVAPERVQRGMASILPRPAPFGIEGLGRLMQLDAGGNAWLAQLRFTVSAVNNGWNQWVLNYSPDRQRGLLAAAQANLLNWRSMVLLACVCALLFAARILRQRRKSDPVDALYWALCHRLGLLGLPRAPDEGPSAYAARLPASTLAPAPRAAAEEFLRRYSIYRYAPRPPDPALVAILKSLLSQIR
jgi:transglutaminase-like putative cysteine protease